MSHCRVVCSGAIRTSSNIYDGAFVQKQLTAKSRELFSEKEKIDSSFFEINLPHFEYLSLTRTVTIEFIYLNNYFWCKIRSRDEKLCLNLAYK